MRLWMEGEAPGGWTRAEGRTGWGRRRTWRGGIVLKQKRRRVVGPREDGVETKRRLVENQEDVVDEDVEFLVKSEGFLEKEVLG